MFPDIRYWLVSQSVGRWSHRLVEDHEESVHFAGPFQKWSGWATVLLLFGFSLSYTVFDKGPLRLSLLILLFIVSTAHLLTMMWMSPVVKKFNQEEFALWFQGHVKNFAWATAISFTLICFER